MSGSESTYGRSGAERIQTSDYEKRASRSGQDPRELKITLQQEFSSFPRIQQNIKQNVIDVSSIARLSLSITAKAAIKRRRAPAAGLCLARAGGGVSGAFGRRRSVSRHLSIQCRRDLWAGLPVLTCSGDSYVGRMAGSLLRAIGLPELVAGSLAEYEALAIELACAPARLAGLRRRLADNRARMPLFDMARYTRGIEAAYAAMWDRWRLGEMPASFQVAADEN